MRNKEVFDIQELFMIKNRPNKPIHLRKTTIANIRKDYEQTYGDVDIKIIHKLITTSEENGVTVSYTGINLTNHRYNIAPTWIE